MKTPEYEKRMSSKVHSWMHGRLRERPSKIRISLCVVKKRLVIVKMIEEDIAILGLLPQQKPSVLQRDLVNRLPDSSGNIPPLLLGEWVGNQVESALMGMVVCWSGFFLRAGQNWRNPIVVDDNSVHVRPFHCPDGTIWVFDEQAEPS